VVVNATDFDVRLRIGETRSFASRVASSERRKLSNPIDRARIETSVRVLEFELQRMMMSCWRMEPSAGGDATLNLRALSGAKWKEVRDGVYDQLRQPVDQSYTDLSRMDKEESKKLNPLQRIFYRGILGKEKFIGRTLENIQKGWLDKLKNGLHFSFSAQVPKSTDLVLQSDAKVGAMLLSICGDQIEGFDMTQNRDAVMATTEFLERNGVSVQKLQGLRAQAQRTLEIQQQYLVRSPSTEALVPPQFEVVAIDRTHEGSAPAFPITARPVVFPQGGRLSLPRPLAGDEIMAVRARPDLPFRPSGVSSYPDDVWSYEGAIYYREAVLTGEQARKILEYLYQQRILEEGKQAVFVERVSPGDLRRGLDKGCRLLSPAEIRVEGLKMGKLLVRMPSSR